MTSARVRVVCLLIALFACATSAGADPPGRTFKIVDEKVGVPGMLRHDCRRSAVRDMVNPGVSERVAMTVTGHKPRAVFDRYHIVSPADLQDVARRLSTEPGLAGAAR